ncbi:MAG TPA: hypothetical protein VJN64_17640 [Terriglobales bacterium]|nr:hypothetical protein [Terriglobales bacterium]
MRNAAWELTEGGWHTFLLIYVPAPSPRESNEIFSGNKEQDAVHSVRKSDLLHLALQDGFALLKVHRLPIPGGNCRKPFMARDVPSS